MERHFFTLVQQAWRDFGDPEFTWLVAALLGIMALSWWIAYLLRHKTGTQTARRSALHAFGMGSLKRITFPVVALVLVMVLRKTLREVGWQHLSLLYVVVPLLVSWALVRVIVYLLRCVLSNGGFLTTFERLITVAIWGSMMLNVTGLDDPLIEIFEQVSFRVGKQTIDLWMLMHGAVTVALTLLFALWIASLLENRLMATEQIDANVRQVLVRVAKALLAVIALLCSLSMVGIDITTLSVFGGALAVGLGMGLQKIASNYVSGFIILLDRSIRLGNLVAVDDATSGTITQITTRYTVLRTLTGVEVIIPNDYLVNNIVRNLSFTDTRLRVTTSVQVAYGTDLERALALMVEAAHSQLRVLADPAPGAAITAFADSGINLEVGFWVADPQAGTGGVRSDINLAIWKSFGVNGIEIPFPQREVRIVSGQALPAA